MIQGRFWGVFFALLTSGFIAETYFLIKGMRKTGGKWIDIVMFLIFLSLPYFIFLMLQEEQLVMAERIIVSCIAFICAASGIIHFLVFRKTMKTKR